MKTTEDDLRAVYVDPPGLADVERRLLNFISETNRAVAVSRVRTAAKNWTVSLACAVTVVAVVVAAPLGLPHQSAGRPSTSTPSAVSPPMSVTSATPPPPRTAPPSVEVTPQVAVQTLISLLPSSGSKARLAGDASPPGWVGGALVYDDGHGAALIEVGLTYPYLSPNPYPKYYGKLQRLAAKSLCSSQGVVQLSEPCTTLANGSQVALYQGTANIAGGAKDWEVNLLRIDGVEVDISEWNSTTEKGGPQTRTDPPFTTAELTAIAGSSKWQAKVSDSEAKNAAGLFAAGS